MEIDTNCVYGSCKRLLCLHYTEPPCDASTNNVISRKCIYVLNYNNPHSPSEWHPFPQHRFAPSPAAPLARVHVSISDFLVHPIHRQLQQSVD